MSEISRSPATPPPVFFNYASPVAPPNSPNSNQTSPVVFRRERTIHTSAPAVSCELDLRAISYVDEVDENLLCPICHSALIEPVTSSCDHTFCQDCIHRSLETLRSCPIDRKILTVDNLERSPKIIYNQLDSLKVTCPCCQIAIARTMLPSHLEKYCVEALIACPGASDPEMRCSEMSKRKFKEKDCLHYMTTCEYCFAILMQVEMEEHHEKDCKQSRVKCELCNEDVLKSKSAEHDETCSETVVGCEWENVGCTHTSKRSDQATHMEGCTYKAIARVVGVLTEKIGSLNSTIANLESKNETFDRRLRFLERGEIDSDFLDETTEYANRILQENSEMPNLPANTDPNDYILAMVEEQSRRTVQVHSRITDLDNKQAQLLFNELVPIKAELNELRSQVAVNSMHIRFLMRFRIQENRRGAVGGIGGGIGGGVVGGGSGSGNGGPGPSSESGSPFPRRSSDSRERL